ncbi:MAG: Calx-beta domain-containing protein [Actinomycetota bacterium]
MRSATRVLTKVTVVTVCAAALPLMNAGTALAAGKAIRIADASIVEGDAGQQDLAFTIRWSGPKSGPAPTVTYATADATATSSSDYTAVSGTAYLSKSKCRCTTVSVPILGDVLTEGTETFEMNLANPVNGTIADAQAIGTIYDNEGPPTLVVSDTSANESAGSLAFTVLLTDASASTITADYATADETATAGTDYTGTSGTLTFTPGQTSKSVAVTIANDALAEDDETVLLNLSNATNTTILDDQGIGTILDDDADPSATIADVDVAEGDAGTADATITVTLDAASGLNTAVDYATSDGTATAGVDYVATSGTLTIAPGQTAGTFAVTVAGDTLSEGVETFNVTLSGEENLTLGDTLAIGTILEDDSIPTMSANDTSVGESAGDVSVTISLPFPIAADVTADWATTPGIATAGTDYTTASGTLSIPAGSTSTTIDLSVLGDTQDEPNETFGFAVSNVVNGSAGPDATITILDDDKAPTALTLRAVKTRTTVKAKGLLETAAPGCKVKVTLQKSKGGRWMRLRTTLVTVKGLRDRDGDGKIDARYVASFSKPARGRYRFRVLFNATAGLKRSSAKLRFTI